jgi:hypothetical protein
MALAQAADSCQLDSLHIDACQAWLTLLLCGHTWLIQRSHDQRDMIYRDDRQKGRKYSQ